LQDDLSGQTRVRRQWREGNLARRVAERLDAEEALARRKIEYQMAKSPVLPILAASLGVVALVVAVALLMLSTPRRGVQAR